MAQRGTNRRKRGHYSHLPEIQGVARNFAQAPAKDVTFDSSAPIGDPDGYIISNLPYFRGGLHFLELEGRARSGG